VQLIPKVSLGKRKRIRLYFCFYFYFVRANCEIWLSPRRDLVFTKRLSPNLTVSLIFVSFLVFLLYI